MHDSLPTMRGLACLLALFALAACDTDGTDPPLPPLATTDTLGTIRIAPRATYLLTNGDDDARPARPLRLDSLGIRPGDALTFFVTGYALPDPSDPGSRSRDLSAVFSSSATLLGPAERRRVPGAIEAGLDEVSLPTGVGGLETDIPEDFFATRATVVVPPSATHLFLSMVDGFFSDNQNVADGIVVTLLRRRGGA